MKADITALGKEIGACITESRNLRRACSEETDRGHVLIAVAHLERRLEEILIKKFIPNTKPKSDLFGRAEFFPDFDSKANGLYLMGVIDEHMKRELGTLRGIRNKCAHWFQEIDLGSGGIGNEVRNLNL